MLPGQVPGARRRTLIYSLQPRLDRKGASADRPHSALHPHQHSDPAAAARSYPVGTAGGQRAVVSRQLSVSYRMRRDIRAAS
jgi:hypothetical protein